MAQLSPLRTKLEFLYGPCQQTTTRNFTSLSPCRWQPRGWKYVQHDLLPSRRPKRVRTLMTTTNQEFFVDPSMRRKAIAKLSLSSKKHHKKRKESFPANPLSALSRTVDLSVPKQAARRPGTCLEQGELSQTLSFWAGVTLSPTIKSFNRRRDSVTNWEEQVISRGVVRRY
jgi:hypothetical protein